MKPPKWESHFKSTSKPTATAAEPETETVTATEAALKLKLVFKMASPLGS